jgi:hypothetical protein
MEYRTKWFKYFLAELTMMKHSSTLFCTQSSGVCTLLSILRGGRTLDTLPERKMTKQ